MSAVSAASQARWTWCWQGKGPTSHLSHLHQLTSRELWATEALVCFSVVAECCRQIVQSLECPNLLVIWGWLHRPHRFCCYGDEGRLLGHSGRGSVSVTCSPSSLTTYPHPSHTLSLPHPHLTPTVTATSSPHTHRVVTWSMYWEQLPKRLAAQPPTHSHTPHTHPTHTCIQNCT